MTVVTEQPNLGSVDPAYVAVEIFLAGEGGVRYMGSAVQISTNESIVASQEMSLDPEDGSWTATLVPNNDISPAGTRWARRLRGYGVSPVPTYANVPDSLGTVNWNSLLGSPPDDIPNDDLQVHEAKIGIPTGHLPPGDTDEDFLRWDADLGQWISAAGDGGGGGGEEGFFAFKQEYPVGLVHVVDHNLEYEPAGVYITDSGGNEVVPESIVHNSINRLTVTLRSAFGPTIRLS